MTTEKDLVVTDDEALAQAKGEKNTYNQYSGGGLAENAEQIRLSIQNGDWDTAGLSMMSAGVDTVGLATDPLGSLMSWGLGWLIEHVDFLRDGFDALMGDPNAIGGMAGSWGNIGDEIQSVADEYRRAAADTTEWEGRAGDAYRNLGSDIAQQIDGLAAAGKGIKGSVEGAGTVVGAVRGIVRDLIATAISDIAMAALRWLAASVATAGIAIGGAIADAIRLALKWADKISGWMKQLGEVLHNLWSKLDNLGSVATKLRKGIDEYFRLLSRPPEGNLLNVQGQKALTKENAVDAAGQVAPSTTTGSTARRGFLGGGTEFKPWAEGDIFKPSFTTAGDGGAIKFSTDTVKEHAKLDDGADTQGQKKEQQ